MMMSSQHYQQQQPMLRFPISSSDAVVVSIGFTRRHPAAISSLPQQIIQNPTKYDDKFIRTHNAKSTSLLFQKHPNADDEIFKLLELSRKTPQFPGSIYVQSPAADVVHVNTPSLDEHEEEEEEEEEEVIIIMRALEIRRQVTLEIFIESMMKAKFGITYATNLGSTLFPHYIDHLMIQAASIKHTPEFANSSFNLRVKASLQSSNLLPLIRWLKHNGLSYPQIGKLICISRGNIESIRSAADWLKSIHVNGRSIGVALLKADQNVFDRNTLEMDHIIWYLVKNGVKREWMGYVVSRCPELLTFTIEELKTRINFYFDMGINHNDFGTMVFDFPKLLGFYSIQEMNLKVAYLMEFGLGKEDVGRLLAFRPQLMGCNIEDRWKPLVKYLYYLGISRDGMRRILTVKPMVFCFDLESNIVQKVQFFYDIGVQEKGIASMLVKFPSLLTYSLYKKIRPVGCGTIKNCCQVPSILVDLTTTGTEECGMPARITDECCDEKPEVFSHIKDGDNVIKISLSQHMPETEENTSPVPQYCDTGSDTRKILDKYFFYDPPLSEETGVWIPVSVPPMSENEHEEWSRGFFMVGGIFPGEDTG